MAKNSTVIFNTSAKKNNIKLKLSPNKKGNPIKLDKNLKSIENRILQKMRNKKSSGSGALTKMPSIERNNSPTIGSSKINLARVHDYNQKGGKNNRYKDTDEHKHAVKSLERFRANARAENTISQPVRQTVAGSFRPNDPDSIIRSIQVPKPKNESHSEYDLYNSYGSSNGFSDDKRMSNRMKNRIKAKFKYRDEVETADSDSFFSSKFSRFNVPQSLADSTHCTNKISKNDGNSSMNSGLPSVMKPTNFPSISKPEAVGGFGLPKI